MLESLPLFLRVVRAKWRGVLWRAARVFWRDVTIDTAQGRLTVYTNDGVIGRELFVHRQFEWDATCHVAHWLRTVRGWTPGNGTVVDIGANMGVIAVGMVRNGLFANAVAIEPEPRNFALLRRNVIQNGVAEEITCVPVAVSDGPGSLDFELSASNFGDHRVRREESSEDADALLGEETRRVISVPVETLDDILAVRAPATARANVQLVWIDIQGFELYAFTGGKQLFSTDIPVVAEIWPYGMRRVGVTQERFLACVSGLWGDYWVFRRGRFVRYPISSFLSFLAELGDDGAFENVIFTK